MVYLHRPVCRSGNFFFASVYTRHTHFFPGGPSTPWRSSGAVLARMWAWHLQGGAQLCAGQPLEPVSLGKVNTRSWGARGIFPVGGAQWVCPSPEAVGEGATRPMHSARGVPW